MAAKASPINKPPAITMGAKGAPYSFTIHQPPMSVKIDAKPQPITKDRILEEKRVAAKNAPPPDVLYNNALRDYNGGKADIASQEFSDYVKFYPNTDLAGNSYYYLGEIQFKSGNYQQAVQSYDQVLQNFPSGTKAASAQLKKGFALVEAGKQDDGVTELRHLIQRYPHSPEALQARDRLRKLGVATRG